MRVDIKSKFIIWAIVILVAAIAIFSVLNYSDTHFEANTLNITMNGDVLQTFSLEDVKLLPAVQVEKLIKSSGSADEYGVYTGIPLSAVLEEAGVDLSGEYQYFVARATDGFTAQYSLEEVLEDDNILVVYTKDGVALAGQEEGGTGPMRIIVMGDSFGNRCTKYLNEIEVK